MRYLSFLIVAVASFSLVSWFLEEDLPPESNKKEVATAMGWPKHWFRDGELMQGVKFISFYSQNPPQKELPICLKHFKQLGYDADGMGLLQTESAIVRVKDSLVRLIINIMPDEQGTEGSSITVQILPKARKENL